MTAHRHWARDCAVPDRTERDWTARDRMERDRSKRDRTVSDRTEPGRAFQRKKGIKSHKSRFELIVTVYLLNHL